jgi:hypothetical protein
MRPPTAPGDRPLAQVALGPERRRGLAAWIPPPGGCGGTLALATVADTMRVIQVGRAAFCAASVRRGAHAPAGGLRPNFNLQ